MSDSKELADARAQAKAEAWSNQGHAGEKIADFMIETVQNLSK